MHEFKKFDTLVETMNYHRKQGYVVDMNLEKNIIRCGHDNRALSPDEFEVDFALRFEGMSDPDDNTILYLISSLDKTIKGQLVNAYGVYADDIGDQMVAKLHVAY